MITQLREKYQDKGTKIVLWITLVAMAIVFAPALFQKNKGPQGAVFSVNDTDISYQDYERRVHQETERIYMFKQQLGAYGEQLLNALGLNNPKAAAFQSLTQETLLNGIAHTIPLSISSDYIATKLGDSDFIVHQLNDVIPLYILDNQGSINQNALNRYLQRYHISVADFDDAIEKKIARNATLTLLSGSTYITQAALYKAFISAYAHKTFSIGHLNVATYKKKSATPTPEQLTIFFNEQNRHSQRYFVPEQRSATMLEFDPNNYGITIDDAAINAYYQSNRQKFVEKPAQVQVRRILLTIKPNADEATINAAQAKAQTIKDALAKDSTQFAQLAQQYSDDKKTAAQGGLLPAFAKGDVDPALETAAFRLRNDNDVSDLITTQQGLEIIQRVTRKPLILKPLEAVRADIKDILLAQEFKTAFNNDAARALQRAKTNNQALSEFAQDKKANSTTIDSKNNDQSPLMQKIFNLKKGDSAQIMHDSKGTVVTVTDIKKAYEPAISSVMDQLKADYKEYAALEAINTDLSAIKQYENQEAFDQELKNRGITLKPLSSFNADDKETIKKLNDQGLPVSQLLEVDKPGTLITGSDKEGNGYVIRLDSIKTPDNSLFVERKQELINTLYNEKKGLIERGFIASLYRNATIKTTELLTNIKEDQLP